MDTKTYNEMIASLYTTWKKLPEETRKKVFEGVYKVDRKLFNKLSKEMNGFSLKGLCSRPPAVTDRIDKKLFAAHKGALVTDFMARFFVNVEVSLNDQFLSLYKENILAAPDTPSRESTEKTLDAIRRSYPDGDLLDLYVAALKIVEPSRFDDKVPDISEFKSSEAE